MFPTCPEAARSSLNLEQLVGPEPHSPAAPAAHTCLSPSSHPDLDLPDLNPAAS